MTDVAHMTPEEFRSIREAVGLSQEKLAAVLGTTQSTVSRWEAHPSRSWARPVGASTAALMRAFRDGYRPEGWPQPSSQEKIT